jgi:DNA mismatch endonuclease (patch repair protein)
VDIYTKDKRSEIMSHVKNRKTSTENKVADLLKKLKIRYRQNVKSLPGEPDFLVSYAKTVIFVHGCFWHNHSNCNRAKLPKTNKNFWRRKIEGNRKRDQRISRLLRKDGWHVITVWQCKLRNPDRVLKRLKRIIIDKNQEKPHLKK